MVVRAIVQSRVPVVSAVGHEIDVTLSDFAADYRAPTPSAAAEAVVPVLDELLDRLDEVNVRLRRTMQTFVVMQRYRLDTSLRILREMRFRMQAQAQRLDELSDALRRSLTGRLTLFTSWYGGVSSCPAGTESPEQDSDIGRVAFATVQAAGAGGSPRTCSPEAISGSAHDGPGCPQSLSDPQARVQCYSRRSVGQVVRRASEVTVGEVLQARLSEGRLLCLVKEVLPHSVS